MRFRVEFERRVNPATTAGQAGMRWSVEIVARTDFDARRIAMAEAARVKKDRMYKITSVRKL